MNFRSDNEVGANPSVIEAVGRPEAWIWATEMVRKGGTVNFFGGCAKGTKVELDTNRLHYSEVTLKATFHHTPDSVRKAFTLIAEKKANPKKGRRFGADPGKVLGEHPDKGGPVVVKNGRYGPYVSNNGVNATITGDKTPETITLTEAVVLLDARAEQLSSQPRRAAGRKKAGEPSEAPKGRKKTAAEPADSTEAAAKPRKKPAKKPAKVTAAE